MKKSYLFCLASLAMASCANDTYLGVEEPNPGAPGSIAFNSSTGKISRAETTGTEAATALGNEFVVEGYKTIDNENKLVFNDYKVTYTKGSTSDSNTQGWEYVSGNQTIKYWDTEATSYTFVAYSLGKEAKASCTAIDNKNLTSLAYKFTGTVSQLKDCYVSNVTKVTEITSSKATEVKMTFKKMETNIVLGFYETIPGYKVQNLKFYESDVAGSQAAPTLYADKGVFPADKAECTMAVCYPSTENGSKPSVTFAQTSTDAKSAKLQYADANSGDFYDTENSAYITNLALGVTATTATSTSKLTMIPLNAGELTLKVDFELLSEDGSNEVIKIKGATAKVPAGYVNWQPNYLYTYIFKITDRITGGDGSQILYPIIFDAVIEKEEILEQETITTITKPSITTYQNGTTDQSEYKAGNIYVSVTGESIDYDNLSIYSVTTTNANNITEGNCIKAAFETNNTFNGVTLTDVTSTKVTTVPGPDGYDMTIDAKNFNATAGETYVAVYGTDADDAVAKVIKVVTTN